MAFSSSQHNLNLNIVQPVVWHPIFISPKGILMTNDSVMLDDDAAAAVANNILIPRDAKLLGDRSIVEAINNSLAFSTQGSASLSP